MVRGRQQFDKETDGEDEERDNDDDQKDNDDDAEAEMDNDNGDDIDKGSQDDNSIGRPRRVRVTIPDPIFNMVDLPKRRGRPKKN